MLAVLLAGPFMAQADATIANVATPSIHAGLGADGAALELVIGGYLIAFAVLLITGARLGQTHGYRRVFLVGVGVFTLSSLACGVAPDPIVLIAARVAQGVGAALMFPQTLTGIQLHFSGAARVRAIGLYSIALSMGAVSGQILGGGLIALNLASSGWRAIFLVNVPLGAIIVAAGSRWLPADGQRVERRVDVMGMAVLSVSVLLLVLPLVMGRALGWPVWAWLCLSASAPSFVLFLATERRVAGSSGSPLLDVGLLHRPAVSWARTTLLATTGSYYALLFTLAQYLQSGLGRSPLESGLTLVPCVAAFGVAGQIVRRVPEAMRPTIPVVGCGLLAATYLGISLALFAGHHGEAELTALLGLGGLGLGLQFSALVAHLTNVVPAERAADISGVATTTMQIGGALGVAAIGSLYLTQVARGGSAQATHAYAVTALGLGGVALTTMLTALVATHSRRLATHAIGVAA